MVFLVSENSFAVEVQVVIVGFKFLVVFDAFNSVDRLCDVTIIEMVLPPEPLEKLHDHLLHCCQNTFINKLYKLLSKSKLL